VISPTIRQVKQTTVTGLTLTASLGAGAGNSTLDVLAGSDVLAFIRTTGNLPADVTHDPDFTLLYGGTTAAGGSPVLAIAHLKKATAGQVDYTVSALASAPIVIDLIEVVGGTIVSGDSPDDFAENHAALSSHLSASTGVMATPTTTRPGLILAAAAGGNSPSTPGAPTAWTNGYVAVAGLDTGTLRVAQLADVGAGPFSSTFSWTGTGTIVRTGIVRFIPDLDVVVPTDGAGWSIGMVMG
jgi:hypothetical protein